MAFRCILNGDRYWPARSDGQVSLCYNWLNRVVIDPLQLPVPCSVDTEHISLWYSFDYLHDYHRIGLRVDLNISWHRQYGGTDLEWYYVLVFFGDGSIYIYVGNDGCEYARLCVFAFYSS